MKRAVQAVAQAENSPVFTLEPMDSFPVSLWGIGETGEGSIRQEG